MNLWKNLSVSKKLYCVVGTMGFLIAMELFTLIFAMGTLSAVRSFVAGESYWSKAQKDSISSLQKYVITQDPRYYDSFLEHMKVPLGDRAARLELENPEMDEAKVTQGLLEGKNHISDIPAIIKLFRRFHNVSHMREAVDYWKEADVLLSELILLAERIHLGIEEKKVYRTEEIQSYLDQISGLNLQLTIAEDGFSSKLGIASRWLESVLMYSLLIAVITIEGTGLILTVSFSRNLTKVLNELNQVANEVARGNFSQKVPIRSGDELGQLAGAINTMISSLRQQIVERENAEEGERKLKTLANSLPQIVLVTNSEGKVQYFNDRWWSYVGRSPQDLNGFEWKDYIHPDDILRVTLMWRRSQITKASYTVEYRLKTIDGVYRWFLGISEPILNNEGEILQWFSTATDIHEQKNARVELQKAVQIRDDFLSVASHELKTPLTTLKLQVQMRKRNLDKEDFARFVPENLRRMFDEDENQLNRLVRLVDDMLDISRFRTGKFALKIAEIDMVKLVKELFTRLTPQLQNSGCEISLDSPEKVIAQGDTYRLEQVLVNLLTNAMKYGNQTPIKVKIAANQEYIDISVTDGGIGISAIDKERIFEQFERAISSSEVSGLGLGLYIAKQIVRAHQGYIFVQSEPGRGSTFTIQLPLTIKELV